MTGLHDTSRLFSGTTSSNGFVFNGINPAGAVIGGSYTIQGPPSTRASGNTIEKALETQVCAAINRNVVQR